ncbi:MAG: hypothetical protein KDA54_18620, partial [Phycisphaerales bacterium]|nr:hypothetical protein [Phycisphaerales bacterium]
GWITSFLEDYLDRSSANYRNHDERESQRIINTVLKLLFANRVEEIQSLRAKKTSRQPINLFAI